MEPNPLDGENTMAKEQEKKVFLQAYCAAIAGVAVVSPQPEPKFIERTSAKALHAAEQAVENFQQTFGLEEGPDGPPGWRGFARVEMMEHRSHLGRIREIDLFGSKMGEIQVMNQDGSFGDVHLFGGKSVYNIDPLTEEQILTILRPQKWAACNLCGRHIRAVEWGQEEYLNPKSEMCARCLERMQAPVPEGTACEYCGETTATARDRDGDPVCKTCMEGNEVGHADDDETF